MDSGVNTNQTILAETLIGREREIHTLMGLVRQVDVRGTALILRGHAGVGKSVLLAAASDHAASLGMHVWTVSGVPAETGVPLAGLHQILRPLLEGVHELAQPHREVLLTSFGVGERSAWDGFVIAIATLELFGAAAREAPLVISVDDAHWLDRETAEVLGFVSRRIGSDRVVLLMTVGEGYPSGLLNFRIPELQVGPLDEKSSSVLLSSRAPDLSPELHTRVVEEAAGNPTALVELASSAESGVWEFGRPDRLATSKRLRTAFAERFLHLPPPTRALLLVASIDDHTSLNEILSAAALMGGGCQATIEDLSPAVDSGLVEHDTTRVLFRHPLTPAMIYDVSSADARRRAHASLATVLIDEPSRRSWHRAASITPPDEAVGNELETAVMNSNGNNRQSMTIAALERAADLSPDPAVRQRRLLRAAEWALDLGQRSRVDRLLSTMNPDDCGTLDKTRMRLLRDLVSPGFVRDPQAVDSLVEAATQAGSAGEREVAVRLLRAAATRTWWADPGPEMRSRVVAAARRIAATDNEPALLSVLAMCDPEQGNEALRAVTSRTLPTLCDGETGFALGAALHYTGVFDRSAAYLAEAIPELRRQGLTWLLPEALAIQSWNRIYVAYLSAAELVAEEAVLVARELGQPMWEAMGATTLSVVHAFRGDEREAESFVADAESVAVPIGARALLADAQFARATIAFSGGRYDEAFEQLQRTFDPNDPAYHHLRSAWRIGEFAEAAVHSGHLDEARYQLAQVSQTSAGKRVPSRLGVGLMYARALLADDDDAEAVFEAALDEDLASWPLYRARLLLQYGMWLRRRRKISQARMPLRAARDSLGALGATAWMERARQELRASRETQHNGPEARLELTEQELQIAEMAAQGLSNREIAQRLYISPRTVGSHLYRIFPKLGVTSRTHLSMILGNGESTEVAS